jgi:hypothetical protein
LVKAPLSANTSREVGSQSDDISNEVMADVLKAVVARVKMVDRRHDIHEGPRERDRRRAPRKGAGRP